MEFGYAVYVEVDGEAYWDIVEHVGGMGDIKVFYDMNGNEFGFVAFGNTDAIADWLYENAYIDEEQAYSIYPIVVVNKNMLLG